MRAPRPRVEGPVRPQDHLVAARRSVGPRRSVRHVTTYLLLLFLLLFSLMLPPPSPNLSSAPYFLPTLVPPPFPRVHWVTVSSSLLPRDIVPSHDVG